ncbi:MAG: O-acetyl-ADP-ribose deacetylase [Bacteroidota bacterium]
MVVVNALRKTVRKTLLRLVRGDITEQDVQAIVNAANSRLMGGGGVDGAIHRAGGPRILEECREIRAVCGALPPGEAVITSGGRLSARFVIHTVGPVWSGGSHGEDHLLKSAYNNSLRLAVENGVSSMAFPSISTGAYGFPVERASRIAMETVSRFVETRGKPREVRFVVFSQHDFHVYARLFQSQPRAETKP